MKTLKLITAGLLATAVASMASAQTLVKLTGSTAFRKATYDAIVNSLNTPKGAAIGGTTADFTGDAQAVITGTLKSGPSAGQAVVFQVAFGGSVGGVHVLTANLTTIPGVAFDSAHTWMSASNAVGTLTVNGDGTISGATILTSGTAAFDAAATAQATNSDTFQATTVFTSPALLQENPTGKGVGVVQFYAVKGLQSPDVPTASYNALTNITAQQYSLLISGGIVPLSVFTGNPSDIAYDVVAVGRNSDSGTREITESETSLGFNPNQAENLYENLSGSPITALTNVGDVGYASGGSVATDLKTPIASGAVDDNGNPFILVGYVGKSDKNTAIAGGAIVLNYNGSAGTDVNIQNGQYSFWGYEHTYFKSGLATIQQNAINLFSTQLRTTDAVQSGLLLTGMGVSRFGDGTPVSP